MASTVIKSAAIAAMLALVPATYSFAEGEDGAEAVDYAAQVAALEGDVKKGKRVFGKCRSCHDAKNEKNKTGPHLVGLIGRPSGMVEDFDYSEAMAGAEKTWDVETLSAYLADPKGYIPDNKMNFAGVKKEADIANVIAYIAEEGGVYEASAE